jgi:hypothetical protein
LIVISEGARTYAWWELCRRAGLASEFLQRWSVAFSPQGDSLVVQPQPGAAGQIRFPLARTELQMDRVVRKTWHAEPPTEFRVSVPDFIVPFCTRESAGGQPLFTKESPRQFVCTEDILASIVLTLSRFEEIGSPVHDNHGRFPASASVAFRHNYLDRPIVDEYGLALQQILRIVMPRWQPAPRSLRVKISHDIDRIGIPLSLKSAIGHLIKRHAPVFCLRDFLSLGTGVEPAFLKQVRDICQLSMERNLHSTVYWMASTPGAVDSGYDVADTRVARVMNWARKQGVEMGVHPGYDTFRSPVLLAEQVRRCRNALQNNRIGGRQHYLRWCPETWVHWEQCGLLYDSTVAFADCAGFRAGTCVPYLPWLWNQNRCADLLEIPLVVMDGTLLGTEYMALEPGQVQSVVESLCQRCAAVGGVFTLLWHNTSLGPPFGRHYAGILDALTGNTDYDWQADLKELRELHGLTNANGRQVLEAGATRPLTAAMISANPDSSE